MKRRTENWAHFYWFRFTQNDVWKNRNIYSCIDCRFYIWMFSIATNESEWLNGKIWIEIEIWNDLNELIKITLHGSCSVCIFSSDPHWISWNIRICLRCCILFFCTIIKSRLQYHEWTSIRCDYLLFLWLLGIARQSEVSQHSNNLSFC